MKITSIFSLFILLFSCCVSPKNPNHKVIIHHWANPSNLNPLTSVSADENYIQMYIFGCLLSCDEQIKFAPDLAVARPTITTITTGKYAGGISLEFEIDKNAVWDNGTPITANDLIFTLKAIFNPLCPTAAQRPYLDFISDIAVDKINPKKFVVYCKQPYFLAESSLGGLIIMPEYVYDEKQRLRNFELNQLKEMSKEKAAQDKNLVDFFQEFSSDKFSQETVIGSGAYKLDKWEKGEFLQLVRKKNYWKDPANKNQYPDTLLYKFINNADMVYQQLVNGEIDVSSGLWAADFMELQKEDFWKAKFNFHSPLMHSYSYFGLNTKNEILADKQVRKALAHLVDRKWIINQIYAGLAKKTNGPINPSKSYYNKNIADIPFDLDKASQLLKTAGWEDTDADGVLDKVINGQKRQLALIHKYSNATHELIGKNLSDNAAKIGVKITGEYKEWDVFLDNIHQRDFELVSSSWQQSPADDDLTQIWHSKSGTADGSNRVGFSNAETDEIIDELKICMDEEKRRELYLRVQEIIADEQVYIFLAAPSERIIINKKFTNTQVSANRPHFNAGEFKLK